MCVARGMIDWLIDCNVECGKGYDCYFDWLIVMLSVARGMIVIDCYFVWLIDWLMNGLIIILSVERGMIDWLIVYGKGYNINFENTA